VPTVAPSRSKPVPVVQQSPARRPLRQQAGSTKVEQDSMRRWLWAQHTAVARHAAGLRPFPEGAFGRHASAPSRGHLDAVNHFLGGMQSALFRDAERLRELGRKASAGNDADVTRFLSRKQATQRLVEATEKVWDFYFRIFSQRQTHLGPRLLASDRISLDSYQAIFLGLGVARSIPAPSPFSYMHGERGAATFRRGVAISLLGHRANPFPLIKIPYHRLLNAWTLGAIPHEVAHNLQAELGLWDIIPELIGRRLPASGIDAQSVATWKRWHKEVFADLLGALLIGPSYVISLTEVVSRSRGDIARHTATAVHPTPLLRPLIALHLLDRLGFDTTTTRRKWSTLYPPSRQRDIPPAFMRSFPKATAAVTDLMCFRPYPQLGNKSLAAVVSFTAKEQALTQEAAGRLAAGNDPGVIPERFLIGAARLALDQRLARPEVINRNFYQALNRR